MTGSQQPPEQEGLLHYSAALTSIDVSQYEHQLNAKLTGLQRLFADIPHPEFEIHRSAPEHYRMRYVGAGMDVRFAIHRLL